MLGGWVMLGMLGMLSSRLTIRLGGMGGWEDGDVEEAGSGQRAA